MVITSCVLVELVANPKNTLHGGQSRSWSAEQGKKKKKKNVWQRPPPPNGSRRKLLILDLQVIYLLRKSKRNEVQASICNDKTKGYESKI